MSGNNTINTGGGNYNPSIYGDNIQGFHVQGNYVRGNHVENRLIDINQEPSEVATQIQQRLLKLQTEGKLSLGEAKAITASELATQAKARPTLQQRLEQVFNYVQEAATTGLIGEAAVEVVKLALNFVV